MAMTEADKITAIYTDLDRSVSFANTQLSEIRKKSWDRVLGRDRGDEIVGRSTVQATTIRDQGYALLATIMPAYATDNIVDFEPTGPNDTDDADAESRALNNIFTEDNSGYMNLSNAVADALWFRNGILKVWVEDKTEITTRKFVLKPGMTVGLIMAGAPEDQEWEHIETEDDVATFRVTSETQKLHIDSIEPSYFYVDPNQQDQNLQDGEGLHERVFFTRSELLEMDIDATTVDELPANEDETVSDTVGSSNLDIAAKLIDGVSDIGAASTRDQDKIECWWVHTRMDTDGDDIGEKWRFLVSNRELLLEDPVEFYPYASGTGWIVPHRWSGLSLYDLLRQSEDQQTNARRQLADNLNTANNARAVYDPGTTKQIDVQSGVRDIRSKDPNSVGWMPQIDVTSQSLQFLQYMDSVVTDQAGAALDMQTADMQGLKDVSGLSVEMQLGPKEQMAAQVSRNLAETMVRGLFLLMHRTLRTDWKRPIMYLKSGDWQETNPQEWQPRSRVNITPGLSPGERRRRASNLQKVRQDQLQIISGGMANVIVDLKGFYNATRDWLGAMELDGAENYYLDPAGSKSQQGQQAAGQAQQADQQKQDQLLGAQVQDQQQQTQIKGQVAVWNKENDDTDNEFDRLELAATLDMKEAELVNDRESTATQGANGGAGGNQAG